MYTPEAGFTGKDSFEYTVSDNQGGSVTQTMDITVEQINDAPTDLVIDNNTIIENISGFIIGDVLVTDIDNGDTHSFVVDDSRFEIVNEQLKLVDGEFIDYATETSVDINITVTDSFGESLTKLFSINVTPEVSLSLDNAEIDENLQGVLVGNILLTNPIPGDAYSFAVNDSRFEIVGNQVSLISSELLDFESEQSVGLIITASSSSGVVTNHNVNVSVNNVNESPEVANALLDNNISTDDNYELEIGFCDCALYGRHHRLR